MPLQLETRWSRYYENKQRKQGLVESKFMDGSASITLAQLEAEWATWDESERLDFCQSVCCVDATVLSGLLRYIMAHGDFVSWSACALSIAACLPADESVPFLTKACNEAPAGKAANFYQALAHTKAPEARPILNAALDRLWHRDDLLHINGVVNDTASDAMWCIKHLIELGEPVSNLRTKYETLSKHPNENNRRFVSWHLAKLFGDIGPEPPS